MSKNRTPEQWQALVDQQLDSGLSATQFSSQQGIAYSTFCKWRKRLSSLPASSAKSLASSVGESSFLDLSALMRASDSTQPGWNIVLSLGNGVELRLSQNR